MIENLQNKIIGELDRKADEALALIKQEGLDALLEKCACSRYRLSKLLSAAASHPVNTNTVNSWVYRGKVPPVPLAAIWGLVATGKLKLKED